MRMNAERRAPPTPEAVTGQRLLEAAGQVFAEKGFRAATVRDIVRRARANLAAVNYHFGGKQGLYAAVLEHTYKKALEKHPPNGGVGPDALPAERLHGFVRSFLQRIFDEDVESCYGRLMAREMADPTEALDGVVNRIRPLYGRLCAIVKELGGSAFTMERVERSAKSIVGQILFYKHAAPVLRRLEGRKGPGPSEIDALARHITDFSLDGLRGGRGRSR